MSQFYAHPYDSTLSGFYFDDYEEYEHMLGVREKRGDFEHEIDYIGTEDEVENYVYNLIAKSVGIPTGARLEGVIEFVNDLSLEGILNSGAKAATVGYVVDNLGGITDFDDLVERVEQYEEALLGEGSLEDVARQMADDLGGVANLASNPEFYFDYERFGRDIGFDLDPDDPDDDRLLDMDDAERGEEFVDNMGGLNELDSETLESYFDYEKFARDLGFEGWRAVDTPFGTFVFRPL